MFETGTRVIYGISNKSLYIKVVMFLSELHDLICFFFFIFFFWQIIM